MPLNVLGKHDVVAPESNAAQMDVVAGQCVAADLSAVDRWGAFVFIVKRTVFLSGHAPHLSIEGGLN